MGLTDETLLRVARALRRWARITRTQPLQRAKQVRLVNKRQMWRKAGEFLRIAVAEQHRDAAAVARAFHIDRGVADKPNLRAGVDAARRQRQMHRLGRRLVGLRVAGTDDAAEQRRPP